LKIVPTIANMLSKINAGAGKSAKPAKHRFPSRSSSLFRGGASPQGRHSNQICCPKQRSWKPILD